LRFFDPKSETPEPQGPGRSNTSQTAFRPWAEVGILLPSSSLDQVLASPGRCSAGASSHFWGFLEQRPEVSTPGLSSPAGAQAPIQYLLILSTWLVWLEITGLSFCLLLNIYES